MNIRLYSEIALAIALAILLDGFSKILPVPRLPYGGSISLHMLPIFVVAFRHGWKGGVAAGGVYGMVHFISEPHWIHPIQFPLDYPIAFGLAGMAGLGFPRTTAARAAPYALPVQIITGVLLGNTLRFLAHFISGIVFWGQMAPQGQPVWLYSLFYNASYIFPETVVDILLLQLLLRRILN